MVRSKQSRNNEHGRDSATSSDIRLEPIGADNRQAVRKLELTEAQRDNVDDNASSLREAKNDRNARPRAVMAGHRAVGFLMYDASDDEVLIYRFMIDRREQGRGYGRAALSATCVTSPSVTCRRTRVPGASINRPVSSMREWTRTARS